MPVQCYVLQCELLLTRFTTDSRQHSSLAWSGFKVQFEQGISKHLLKVPCSTEYKSCSSCNMLCNKFFQAIFLENHKFQFQFDMYIRTYLYAELFVLTCFPYPNPYKHYHTNTTVCIILQQYNTYSSLIKSAFRSAVWYQDFPSSERETDCTLLLKLWLRLTPSTSEYSCLQEYSSAMYTHSVTMSIGMQLACTRSAYGEQGGKVVLHFRTTCSPSFSSRLQLMLLQYQQGVYCKFLQGKTIQLFKYLSGTLFYQLNASSR